MSAEQWEIRATAGQYLRPSMRSAATRRGAEAALREAAEYIGEPGQVVAQDGGDLVLGTLVARRVQS